MQNFGLQFGGVEGPHRAPSRLPKAVGVGGGRKAFSCAQKKTGVHLGFEFTNTLTYGGLCDAEARGGGGHRRTLVDREEDAKSFDVHNDEA